jgi:hypothetical protein
LVVRPDHPLENTSFTPDSAALHPSRRTEEQRLTDHKIVLREQRYNLKLALPTRTDDDGVLMRPFKRCSLPIKLCTE